MAARIQERLGEPFELSCHRFRTGVSIGIAMNITLSPELEKLVNEKVQNGEFENAEAVVAQVLHALAESDRDEAPYSPNHP